MNNMENNFLIVGKGAAASALARKLSQNNKACKIYITDSQKIECEYFETIDIREDDLTGLLKFVIENNITLTIPVTETALKTDIVSFFQSNGQPVFGPCKSACKNFINKVNCKKFLYKNKAQSTKFAIYSKYTQAIDYIKNAVFPLIISSPEPTEAQDSKIICTTFSQTQEFLERIFLNGETDVLIQEYPYGTDFSAYFVTDGYSAVLLNTVRNYKFTNKDKSGKYTDGTGCIVPEYRVNIQITERLKNIVTNILSSLDNSGTNYVGIVGLECVLTDNDKFYVQDVKTFLQNHDAASVLNLCEENLETLMLSCINGFFSDEYEEIKTSDRTAVSVTVECDEEPENITNEDYCIDYNNEISFVISQTAPTLARAKEKLKQILEIIEKTYKIKYRKDICDKIEM